jgi:hypothetical protein
MDDDMSSLKAEFRAQRKLLQALHITQQEHTVRLERLETGQAELRTEVGRIHVGVKAILGLLGGDPASGD